MLCNRRSHYNNDHTNNNDDYDYSNDDYSYSIEWRYRSFSWWINNIMIIIKMGCAIFLNNVWLCYSLLINFYFLFLVSYFVKPGYFEICTGMEYIDTLNECKVATGNLSLSFIRTKSDASFPKGCHKYYGGPYVYWNTHSGRKSSSYHPICKIGE